MTECHALIAAILARPADDLPRLALADWFDDHADELPTETARRFARTRAEFIRVGCELARTADPDRRLIDREAELCKECRGDLPDGCRIMTAWQVVRAGRRKNLIVTFRRGFAERFVTTPELFARSAATLFAAHPIYDVGLIGREPIGVFREGRGQWRGAEISHRPAERWMWTREVPTPQGWSLPAEVFDCLSGGQHLRGSQRQIASRLYPSRGAAESALSLACVARGRELAGLPPLGEAGG